LTPFAHRFPKDSNDLRLKIGGLVANEAIVSDELLQLPRVEQNSGFHCVTTWSCRALQWSGFRFADFFEQIVQSSCSPANEATVALLWAQDGYRTTLPLEDLLSDDALLTDRLNSEPLPIEHGAPWRMVVPAHYGYKNVKHLNRIEFLTPDTPYRAAGFRFMDHLRAPVAQEERGRGLPGWIYRHLYRPLIRPTVRRFREEMTRFERMLED